MRIWYTATVSANPFLIFFPSFSRKSFLSFTTSPLFLPLKFIPSSYFNWSCACSTSSWFNPWVLFSPLWFPLEKNRGQFTKFTGQTNTWVRVVTMINGLIRNYLGIRKKWLQGECGPFVTLDEYTEGRNFCNPAAPPTLSFLCLWRFKQREFSFVTFRVAL